MRSVVLRDRLDGVARAIAGKGLVTSSILRNAEAELFGEEGPNPGVVMDPYCLIRTRGRRGAHKALELQQRAFAESALGQRRARPRQWGRVFQQPLRQRAFEKALAELRRAFPDATDAFVFGRARAAARRVKVERKRKPKVQPSVAQTYCAPSRGERSAEHRAKMEAKGKHRAGRFAHRPARVRANLSDNHPDAGCSTAEHAARKRERKA